MTGHAIVGLLELEEYEETRGFITEIFEKAGLEADVSKLPGDVEQAEHAARTRVFDVIVSDLSLGRASHGNLFGLNFLSRIKSLCPDVLCIGVTRYPLKYYDTAFLPADPDLLFLKDLRGAEEYIRTQSELLRGAFAKNAQAYLDLAGSSLSPRFTNNAEARTDLERMLRSVTFTLAGDSQQVNRIVLTPLKGGFSDSDVYRMQTYTPSGLECVRGVLKVSDHSDTIAERNNYLRFVKWFIPYTWRVELLGSCLTGELGSICYSFAYDDEVIFAALSESIRNGESKVVDKVIRNIFGADHQRWYNERNIDEVKDENLAKFAYQRWFEGKEEPRNLFTQTIQGLGLPTEVTGFSAEGFDLEWPWTYLFSRSRVGFSKCICHGDLHGGNILVTPRGDMSFIDFRHTGLGSVFDDFVIFETSIRVDFARDDTSVGWPAAEELISEELALLRPSGKSSLPYKGLVHKVRRAAWKNFPSEPKGNYVFLLAAWSFRLLRAKTLELAQQQRLAACIVACMIRMKSEAAP